MARHTGFTLIELMVTIAIMTILMLLAIPLTMSWVNSAQVGETKSLLMQGFGHAKSVALRNPDAIKASDSDRVAGLKLIDGATLLVCKGDPTLGACAEGGGNLVWQTDLTRGTGVNVTFNSSNSATVALDNTGMPLDQLAYSISKGSENESGTFH